MTLTDETDVQACQSAHETPRQSPCRSPNIDVLMAADVIVDALPGPMAGLALSVQIPGEASSNGLKRPTESQKTWELDISVRLEKQGRDTGSNNNSLTQKRLES